MKSKVVTGIVLTLFLISMLTLAFNIQPVRASGTIYIRADGSIEPSTANITSTDNVTYYFTDNIYDEIVVERDNIVVDGTGYTLRGTGSGYGIDLTGRSNVTIKNIEIKEFWNCIWLEGSSNNRISKSNITNNNLGIELRYSSNNTLTGNNITNNNQCGIRLEYYSKNNSILGNKITNNTVSGVSLHSSSGNSLSGNNITENNAYGVWLSGSSNNTFYHNNFIDNTQQVNSTNSLNTWDDGYPSGGNYWSDYTDVDQYSGPYQNETGNDGIWDHPYVIDENNQDNYPIVPEFPTWTSILLILIVLTVATAINKRRLNKTPIIHREDSEL